MRLWLRTTVIEHGTWLLAHVRVRNASGAVRFHEDRGPCVGDPFHWDLDITGLFDPGREWPGLAGVFKRQATRWPIPGWTGILEATEVTPPPPLGPPAAAPAPEADVGRFAECTGGPALGLGRLASGRQVRDRYAWYPSYLFDRPLPPGPFRLSVAFQDWGGGPSPDRRHPPLTLEAALLVPGPDPGYVSPYVLVDRALSDPRFFAFVTRPPGRRAWINPSRHAWPRRVSAQARWVDLPEDLPGGFIEIGLFRDGPGAFFGVIMLDPWSGEVLAYGEQ